MTNINRLVLLTLSLSSMTMAQLPFFLQRFRPAKHGLLSSGSSSYPSFASSLFPLSSSSSLLSPTYGPPNSFLSSSGYGSSPFAASGLGSFSLSSPFSASASSLSPHFGASSLPSSHFGASSLPSSHFGSSLFHGSGFASPSFASSQYGSHHLSSPHRFASSNVAHSLDLGSVGNYEGLGGIDQAELVEDYPGFSNAGFAKDLNFAGSQTVKLQSHPQAQYTGGDLVYYQRSAEKK